MLDQTVIKKCIQLALDQGHLFAEVFCEKSVSTSLSMDSHKLNKIRNGIDSGTGFRIINGEKTYYGYVNSLEPKDILALAQRVSSFAKQAKSNKLFNHLNTLTPNYLPAYELLPDTISIDNKIKFLKRANKAAWALDKRIVQVSIRYADTTQEILVANSTGILATDKRVRTRFVTEAVAQDKNSIQTGYEAPGHAKGLEIFDLVSPEEVAIAAAKRAILSLEADKAPAGEMAVVLAGSAGGTMVHEACGHALEADFIYKQTSIFTKCLKKKTVSELITVVDDGTIPGNYGSTGFDDEGTPTQKNILIQNGVVTNFMNDLLYAKLLKMAPTGNGRRESYRYSPIPRMTNTYIQAGQSNYPDILSSVKEGLLVKKMGGGQVDITNGNFVFEVSEGYLIKNYKIDRPVRGATLVGNGVDVLSAVDMVGNDLCYIPGVCGKGQGAPVSDGQPTLRIPKIIVGGQS